MSLDKALKNKTKDSIARIKKAGATYSPKHSLYSKEGWERNKKGLKDRD